MDSYNYIVPKFKSHTILRSLDLDEINKNIHYANFMMYKEYNDGIILGLDVETDGEYIYVDKGIYKYGETIILGEKLSIKIPNIEGDYYLGIKYSDDEDEYTNFKKINIDFFNLGDNNYFELARFHIRDNVKLSNSNYELKKYSKEYNSLNVNEAMYSLTGLNPKILKIWANKMLELKVEDSFDLIIPTLASQGLINRELLIKYTTSKLKLTNAEFSNFEILENLYFIYNKLKEKSTNNEFDIKKIKVD